MWTPSHGAWCNARAYPTTCRYCGKRVFFFCCDHGSKVFFDSLGRPWPEHACIEYALAVLGVETVERAMEERLKTPKRWGPGSRLEPSWVERVVRTNQQPRRDPPHLARVSPAVGDTATGVGYLREVVPRVDMYAFLDISESHIGAQLLGPLGTKPHIQITLHTGDLSRENRESYTCMVPEDLVGKRLRKGTLVEFRLVAFTVPGRRTLWLCDHIAAV